MNNDHVTDLHKEERLKQLQDYRQAVYNSRNALFISAGILLLSEVVRFGLFNQMADTYNFVMFALMFASFIGLALWTKKKPYTPLRIGIIIYLVYIIVNALPFIYNEGLDGIFKGIYNGIFYKAITMLLIARAAPKAKAMQTLNEAIDE